jgi:glycosyltransferase involved in cell wall biosynthesis
VATIDFIHLGRAYSGETLRTQSMGGIQSSTVQLAEELAKRGHDVFVFNDISSARREYGVHWRPIQEAFTKSRGEIGVAVANPKAFMGLPFRKRIYWPRTPLRSWTQIRRGHVLPLLRSKPHFVLLGAYHSDQAPRWLPSSGRTIIQHGVQKDFFRDTPADQPPPPRAIFASQPYRGLDWLLDLWGEIKRQVPNATFDVFAPKAHEAAANAMRGAQHGVTFCGSLARPDLARELRAARVQLTPGHKHETYCAAAAEATVSGLPIVTLGLGSLSERVKDGETGFIARNKEEFIARTVAILSDDDLWRAMHRACLADNDTATWDVRAAEWEALFARL